MKNKKKTICAKGHKYSLENTRVSKKGYRVCKECDKLRARKYRKKSKGTNGSN